MPLYEVEYSYPITEYGITQVTASTMEDAENVALEQLSDSLGPEIIELDIESIREIKQ